MAHAHTRSCQLILVAREAQWVCELPTGGPGRASVQIVLRDVGIEHLLRYPVWGQSGATLAMGLVRRCVASKPGCSEKYQWWSRSSIGFGQRNSRCLAQVLRGARHSLDMATRPRVSALRTTGHYRQGSQLMRRDMRPSLTGTNHCTCYGETGHVQNKFLLGPVSAAPPLFCLPPKPSRDQRDSKKHSADTHTPHRQ